MFNIKLFPQFQVPAAATAEDQRILQDMLAIRSRTTAICVNFSVFDYTLENPDVVHFLTYPMHWIAAYIRNFYPGIDPLNSIDFRGRSVIDWSEIYSSGPAARLMHRFSEAGLGDYGLSLCTHGGGSLHGVLSVTFGHRGMDWGTFKKRLESDLGDHAAQLLRLYCRLHLNEPDSEVQLTPRELEVLRLVALGRTDDQIADMMGIGRWTVVSHLRNAKFKLGCANRAAAVATAITSGLIEIGGPLRRWPAGQPKGAISMRSS